MLAINPIHSSAPDHQIDEPHQPYRPALKYKDNSQVVSTALQEAREAANLLVEKLRKKRAEACTPVPLALPMITLDGMPPGACLSELGDMALEGMQEALPLVTVALLDMSPVLEKASARHQRLSNAFPSHADATAQSGSMPRELLSAEPGRLKRDNGVREIACEPSVLGTDRESSLLSAAFATADKAVVMFSADVLLPMVSINGLVLDSKGETQVIPTDPLLTPARLSDESTWMVHVGQHKASDIMPPLLVAQTVSSVAENSITPEHAVFSYAQALPTALSESTLAEGPKAHMTGGRTLSYTFSQWRNSPTVTFELSASDRLIAMTDSAEVQQALLESQHWLMTESELHFRERQHREKRQSSDQEEA